jgi:hypothetical protein
MDTIGNLLTASLFNEPSFNLHVLKNYWIGKEHATAMEEWLDVIGEFEMLNSLANFAYNNTDLFILR